MDGIDVLMVLILLVVLSISPANADLFITNAASNSVLRVDSTDGGLFEVFIPAVPNGPINPQRVVVGPDGNLYVSSFGAYPSTNGGVNRYDPDTGAYLGVFVPVGSGGLQYPGAIAFGPNGNLYVSDPFGAGMILVFNGKTGLFLGALGGAGIFPIDMTFGPDGLLYVASGSDDVSIVRFDPGSGLLKDTLVPTGSGLAFISGMAFGPDGNLYIGSGGADGLDNTVRRYNFSTQSLSTFTFPEPGVGPSFLTNIAFGPDGNLYVCGFVDGSVIRYDGSTGAFLDVFAFGDGSVDGFGLSSLTFSPLAPQQTRNLIQSIQNLNLPKGVSTSLQAPLKNIVKLLEDNNPANDGAACGKLDAFIDTVEDQVAAGSLGEATGVELILKAEAIKQNLGCV
jgi:WD40 repeat protein